MGNIDDGGERISYGDKMAIREPATGKGRYDLVSPFALDRLAKWYELGSKKYTKKYEVKRDDLLSVVKNELERIIDVPNVVQINYTVKTCVEVATRNHYEQEIKNILCDNERMQISGEENIQNGSTKRQSEEEKIHIAEKEIEERNVGQTCKKWDLRKIHMNYYLNGKIIDVLYAEEHSMMLEQYRLIMTIHQDTHEDCYVVAAITDLECLKSLLILCKKLYPTFSILQLTNSSQNNNNYEILISGDRNWEKGMPFSRYVDSAKRHLNKFLMGMEDEDHLAAAAWNIFGLMHHEELQEYHLDDLPHYLSSKKGDENEKT